MGTKIADLLPEPEKVNLGRGDLVVHGLSMQHLARLLVVYKDQLLVVLAGGLEQVKGLAMTAPEMVTDIIMAAANIEEEERASVQRIPVAKQVEILGAVYKMSVPDEKKFEELLAQLLVKLQQLRSGVEAAMAGDTGKSSETSLPSGSAGPSALASDSPK